MTREQVVEILASKRRNMAMLDYHSAQLEQLEMQLQAALSSMIVDSQNITAQLTGMPHGSGISDQTANLAIKLADGWQTDRVRQVRVQIERVKQQIQRRRTLIKFADAWMKCLTDRQRFVVQGKTISGMFIRDIKKGMADRFQETYSDNGIRTIERTAIDTICSMLEGQR